MTVHITSVGVSILDHLQAPRTVGPVGPVASGIAVGLPRGLIEEWRRLPDRGRAFRDAAQAAITGTDDPYRLKDLATRAATELWPSQISAETDSLSRSGGAQRHHLGTDGVGNLVVLIASDTAPGVTAAFWVAAAITAGNLESITWVDDLGRLNAVTPRRPTVLVIPIKGMDVGSHAGFKDAMGHLGGLLNTLLQAWTGPTDPVEFHLSGGYKATVAYLLAMAEWTRTASSHQRRVTAWILHEESDGRIAVPLRRIPRATDELKDIRALNTPSTTPPRGKDLEGYAYEKNQRGLWVRTAFGEGLVRVLPARPGD